MEIALVKFLFAAMLYVGTPLAIAGYGLRAWNRYLLKRAGFDL